MPATLRFVAPVAGVVAVGMAVVAAILRTVTPIGELPFSAGTQIDFWLLAAMTGTYAVVGVLLGGRVPRNPVPWIFLGIALAFGGVLLTWAYAGVAVSSQPTLANAQIAALVNTAVLQPVGLALVVPLLYLFPDGRPVSHRARRLIDLSLLMTLLIFVGVVITPGSIGIFTGLENPFGVDLGVPLGRVLTIVGVLATVGLGLLGCRSLLTRFRTADDRTRDQIRWFVWAASIATAVAGVVLVIFATMPELLRSPLEPIIVASFAASASLIPIACAIAILRHQLYDIDRLISGTFVYWALVAIVAGGYSAGMTALGRFSESFVGDSDLPVVLTTLLLAISFEPMKRRLERFAERFVDEDPAGRSAVAGAVSPDDAWVDAVAKRVVERLEGSR